MKLFVLLSRFPYPLEKGDKLRAYWQLRELGKRHEVHLCCLSDKKVSSAQRAELEKYCATVTVHLLKKRLIYWNVIKQCLTNYPYQVGYFYQRHIQRKIDRHIAQLRPDHLFCQLIRTAEYVKNHFGYAKTIDYMDALSRGMYRRAASAKGLYKRLLNAEGRRLSVYEHRMFDYFNRHCIISEQDRKHIAHPQNRLIQIVENGIDPSFFETVPKTSEPVDLLFTGNMHYAPNVACAEFIAHQILPLLSPSTCLLIAGAAPHPRVKKLALLPQVTVTGWLEDIRTAYHSARIFVAPLFTGTGLQNKLLEAMATGLPCVTTSMANNALGAQPDRHVLIAENARQFAEHIRHLLEDENSCDALAQAGKDFVKRTFSWEKSTQKIEHLLRGKHPSQPPPPQAILSNRGGAN